IQRDTVCFTQVGKLRVIRKKPAVIFTVAVNSRLTEGRNCNGVLFFIVGVGAHITLKGNPEGSLLLFAQLIVSCTMSILSQPVEHKYCFPVQPVGCPVGSLISTMAPYRS